MRILLVDDERHVLDDSYDVLKLVFPNAEILATDAYKEAVDFLKEHVDIVFLDVDMPGYNGIELAKKLKLIQEKMNIVFLTGYEQYALKAYQVQASDYLLKPLTPADVTRAVSNLRYPILEMENHKSEKRIKVVCFDRFTVFCNGCTMRFRRDKCKEMFAYLISKRGTGASIIELCDVLWPEDADNIAYCRKIVSELRRSLREYGFDDILLLNNKDYSLDVTEIDCDYYDYLDGKLEWNGKFMEQYSLWAEERKGSMYFDMICR